MTTTTIQWTDEVWNPTTGCDRVSAGCDNCYALKLAKRLKAMGSDKYQRDGDPKTSGPGFGLTTHPGVLAVPFDWRRPRKVFVNSMSDLFHADVPVEFIAEAFAVMAATPRHTYQLLTKRHGRIRSVLSGPRFQELVQANAVQLAATGWFDPEPGQTHITWPLPNVWIGVSVEDQKHADLRVPALLATPAAVRWLSCEPLLGAVDRRVTDGMDWVVVGGESGSTRPMAADWARELRDGCAEAGVPFFFKQAGWALAKEWGCSTKKGDLPADWPEPFPREFPRAAS